MTLPAAKKNHLQGAIDTVFSVSVDPLTGEVIGQRDLVLSRKQGSQLSAPTSVTGETQVIHYLDNDKYQIQTLTITK